MGLLKARGRLGWVAELRALPVAFLAHSRYAGRAPVPVPTTTEVSCLWLLSWGQLPHHHLQPANGYV